MIFRFLLCFLTARQVTIPSKIYRGFLWSDLIWFEIINWFISSSSLYFGIWIGFISFVLRMSNSVRFNSYLSWDSLLNILGCLISNIVSWIWSGSVNTCQVLSLAWDMYVITSPVFSMDSSYKGLRYPCLFKCISWSVSPKSRSFLTWKQIWVSCVFKKQSFSSILVFTVKLSLFLW